MKQAYSRMQQFAYMRSPVTGNACLIGALSPPLGETCTPYTNKLIKLQIQIRP